MSSQNRGTVSASYRAHAEAAQRLGRSYRALPTGSTVRLAKKTSNIFRTRAKTNAPGLDVTGLDSVIAVDTRRLTVEVSGMCTYENLVAATLKHGLRPLVVPQLKTITVGGAITGLGIESTSFRHGLVHESVVEIDILTGDGEIVTATPTNEHSDLFYGFPNSYGSLGYAVRVVLELAQVKPYVRLEHLRYRDLDALEQALTTLAASGTHRGFAFDFLDGVVFSPTESYLTVGTMTDEPGPVSNYTGQGIYYRSLQRRTSDRLTIADYLWRWDTDWFWCSRAFGAQNRVVRRLWPQQWRRSSAYWKLVALDRRFGIADRIQGLRGRPPEERVVQDIEIPVEQSARFLDWFLHNVPITPLWLCPLRNRQASRTAQWPLYPIRPGQLYINVGFWSAVPGQQSGEIGHTNRLIEREVSRLGGHKSLYSDAYYTQAEFEKLYGASTYTTLKKKYDPDGRLLDMYEKTVGRR
ncbi:FAD-binding oxidoreductase [Nakamurella antarctica]|uniref:Delta(24)-sterol reductase n=1 Tax=Nakamurella antarctica TaxID=1902245 RepID=A0A3G8ZLG6_9ACTN|nr:FAD-binding oxidoreductase [Nakamurella antarctica]AZI57998.1 FAD-binding oxidoreductase [Nakamurella antarctica]